MHLRNFSITTKNPRAIYRTPLKTTKEEEGKRKENERKISFPRRNVQNNRRKYPTPNYLIFHSNIYIRNSHLTHSDFSIKQILHRGARDKSARFHQRFRNKEKKKKEGKRKKNLAPSSERSKYPTQPQHPITQYPTQRYPEQRRHEEARTRWTGSNYSI